MQSESSEMQVNKIDSKLHVTNSGSFTDFYDAIDAPPKQIKLVKPVRVVPKDKPKLPKLKLKLKANAKVNLEKVKGLMAT
jgi:hypothetical protein